MAPAHPRPYLAYACIAAVAIAVRCGVMLGPHSGEGRPPMFGDYEAQRHWMETTLSLPATDWYRNTTDNDLMYWGLDYPPLTAWHSLVLGWIGEALEPESMALGDSRGYSTPSSRLFMRLSVLVTDVLVYFTGALAFCMAVARQDGDADAAHLHFAFLLFQPAVILIDHGHFQYNTVSLGLTLWAAAMIVRDRDVAGSVLYSLALNHKQMSMYHAPAFFCFLLARALASTPTPTSASSQPSGPCPGSRPQSKTWRVLRLVLAVTGTFVACWLPACVDTTVGFGFGFGSIWSNAGHVLHRLFPFARGLYEDKVANFWCAAGPILRIRDWLARDQQVVLCLVVTALSLLPSCVRLLLLLRRRRPRPTRIFVASLFTSALAFFLFSFQVHEKSILIALLPASMMWSAPEWRWKGASVVLVGTFSMWPLVQKDGLELAYAALMLMYAGLCLATWLNLNVSDSDSGSCSGSRASMRVSPEPLDRMVVGAAASVVVLGHGFSYAVGRPGTCTSTDIDRGRYPDLADFGVSALCAAAFLVAWAWASAWIWLWVPGGDGLRGRRGRGGIKSE